MPYRYHHQAMTNALTTLASQYPAFWLRRNPTDATFFFHPAARLFKDTLHNEAEHLLSGDLMRNEVTDAETTGAFRYAAADRTERPLIISTPERAVLELLDELPRRQSFHQVDMLFEGLTTLSPGRLQRLLEQCRSVKVKRLFLWFADRHRHAWHKYLDTAKIHTGAGKRSLVKGGRLVRKYQITVPEDMYGIQR